MGKYLIRIESMDGFNDDLDQRYQDGIEANGFCILADQNENDACVAIHNLSVDDLSTIIAHNPQALAAGVLAKAKKDAIDIQKRGMMDKELAGLFGRLAGRNGGDE